MICEYQHVVKIAEQEVSVALLIVYTQKYGDRKHGCTNFFPKINPLLANSRRQRNDVKVSSRLRTPTILE